ncbi:AMP-binding protein [Pelotomaculum terephthalicicum JT]|uniref:(2,3-dihydroxybenzoyl)adenylate synthase n=1 Tax=Pelotomaculum TaxID=191373 RepID=UPI0009D17636|nr:MULTISPECIES: AMP-binding protein [Pelotomaculum]MCG9969254.1 AMP-binding protein [Pelotomaculum terephthalicicum JT]OPX86044.1 MAG: 2,3-dihydroxybenzoate-AMP ligase [Pelotomaculum sp. PtaB.Bin117]OPY61194.1 MAG: 2,3-dihydroxybenzoate-AMP ligase [Pelotomaculum sp. PtaU1.Bin065]
MLEGFTPWPEAFGRLYRENGYWSDLTLGEMLESSVEKYGSKEALIYGDLRITYNQLGEKVNRLAHHFWDLGLKPLDRVVFQLANTPENVYTFLALVKIGVIPVMALPAHRFTEISYFVQHADAVATFTPTVQRKFDYVSMVEQVRAEQHCLKYIFIQGEAKNDQISLEALLDSPIEHKYPDDFLARYRPDPDEVAFMLLSGGTTGIPKLIPRTHNDYVYNIRQSGKVGGYDEDTVFLAVLPIAHNYTLGCPGLLAALYYGGKAVISPGLDEETVFSLVEKEKVTIIAAAVPLVSRWVSSPVPLRYDISSLKVIQNGGARLAPELRKHIVEQFKCKPQEVFGTGEGLLSICPLDADEDMLINSSGVPISPGDEIKVVDDNGNEVPDGQTGELIVRGPYTIRGYYKAPEHNSKSFTADGFYRTGDIVRKNERGYLFTEGRKKDLINRGGEKISCEEVENYILANPKVENVCLVAMPDEVFGEKACAFVLLKAGETMTFEELKDFLRKQNIAAFKLPERLEIVSAFPLSPAGKILKRKLREDIIEKLAKEKASKNI